MIISLKLPFDIIAQAPTILFQEFSGGRFKIDGYPINIFRDGGFVMAGSDASGNGN